MQRSLPAAFHVNAILRAPKTPAPDTSTQRPFIESLERRQLFAAGDLDLSFGVGGKRELNITSDGLGPIGAVIATETRNGKTVIVTGDPHRWWHEGGGEAFRLIRLNSDGRLDKTFDDDGVVWLNSFETVAGIAIQADGRILVAGDSQIVRLLNNGQPDWAFSFHDGERASYGLQLPFRAGAPLLMKDGRIVVPCGGRFFAAARLLPSGAFDTTFGGSGVTVLPSTPGFATHAALFPDGRIVLGGLYDYETPDAATRIIAVHTNGTLDPTYAAGSGFGDADILQSLTVGPQGEVFGVQYTAAGPFIDLQPYRLDNRGAIVPTYEPLRLSGDDPHRFGKIEVSAGGKLTLFAKWRPRFDSGLPSSNDNVQGFSGDAVIRWDADGTFDRSLNGSGSLFRTGMSHGDVLPDGKLLGVAVVNGRLLVQRRIPGPNVTPTIVLATDGTLGIEGSPAADTIRVTRAGGNIRVMRGNAVTTFPANKVKRIFLEGGRGDDQLTVERSVGLPHQVSGGFGNDRIVGGDSPAAPYLSKLMGNQGNDRITLLSWADVEAGTGSDVIDASFVSSASIRADEVDFHGNSDEENAVDTLTFESRTAPLDFVFEPGSKGSLLSADGLSGFYAAGVEKIVGGKGNDRLRTDTSETGSVPVWLVGGPGDDHLTGGAGDDILDGGPGRDRAKRDAADKTVSVEQIG